MEIATCHGNGMVGRKRRGKTPNHNALSNRIIVIHPCNFRQPQQPPPPPRAPLLPPPLSQSARPAAPIPHKSPRSVARWNPIRFRSHSHSNSSRSGVAGRHGGGTRRRIGGEGRRLGRRAGARLGLARHPAAALLRLHLHLLRVGSPTVPPSFVRIRLTSFRF